MIITFVRCIFTICFIRVCHLVTQIIFNIFYVELLDIFCLFKDLLIRVIQNKIKNCDEKLAVMPHNKESR